jgi:hypothetical protein
MAIVLSHGMRNIHKDNQTFIIRLVTTACRIGLWVWVCHICNPYIPTICELDPVKVVLEQLHEIFIFVTILIHTVPFLFCTIEVCIDLQLADTIFVFESRMKGYGYYPCTQRQAEEQTEVRRLNGRTIPDQRVSSWQKDLDAQEVHPASKYTIERDESCGAYQITQPIRYGRACVRIRPS